MSQNNMDLTGKVALVTGAGQGLGEGIAGVLADRGARVVVNDLVQQRANAVATRLNDAGAKAVGIAADVSVPDDVRALVRSVDETFGPVDVLVNNAGITGVIKHFVDHTVEEWDLVFVVNCRGIFLTSQAVLASMIERRSGVIVNIASIAAFKTTSAHSAYAASKAAVVALTRDLASEVAEYGVRVNAVAPGPTRSHIGVLLPDEGIGGPLDIGNAVAFLASDAARFITGETLPVAGGANLRFDRQDTRGRRFF